MMRFLAPLLFTGMLVMACASPASEELASDESSLNQQAAGGGIGSLCTEAEGNPLGRFIVDAVGGGLPDSDKAASALCNEARGRPTTECKDYCEARNPGTTASAIADVLS